MLLATLAMAATVLTPTRPATAFTAADGTCPIAGSVHLSNGVHLNPLYGSAGVFNLVASVAACAGSQTGTGLFQAVGAYGGPVFAGAFNLYVANGLSGTCNGSLNAERGEAVMAGTLTGVLCTSSTSPGVGALSFTLEPNPQTLNTCGTPGTADIVVCDFFIQGSIA